ncbi:3-isopropylmalate dehydrogenase [Hutsoniella sourekii]
MSKIKKIALLAGDGIGPEIAQAGRLVLEAALDLFPHQYDYQLIEADFGGVAIDHFGNPYPQETQAICQSADAILLGAIGGPQYVEAKETPEEGLLALRKQLKLYANLRPTQINPALLDLSPLKAERVQGADFVIVRELIGGLYFGKPKYYNNEEAFDTLYYSRKSIQAIVNYAFELAMTRRKHLTSIDKANVLASSKLWRQIVEETKERYPEVTVTHMYVDAAAMKMITQPTAFDVIVTENLFGDILSDEASVITGSLGLLPSASLSLDGPSLYEPIHGSAPDIAGLDVANPMSMILSITLMLRLSFAEDGLAQAIEQACQAVMVEGVLTQDLGGTATSSAFTQAVIQQMQTQVQ